MTGISTGRRILCLILVLLASSSLMLARETPAMTFERPTILFVGNSFIQGGFPQVRDYGADRVADLGGTGRGGMPAMFRNMCDDLGIKYSVVQETAWGVNLTWHSLRRTEVFARPWDVVVLQEYSMLSEKTPLDTAATTAAVRTIAAALRKANPAVKILIMGNWARADQIYPKDGYWHGKGRDHAFSNLHFVTAGIGQQVPGIAGVIPVGLAWNRAIAEGVASADPYQGRQAGKVNLWSSDNRHASFYGHYLQALTIFGAVTGRDPATLSAKERTLTDGVLDPKIALALRRVASQEFKAAAGRSGRTG